MNKFIATIAGDAQGIKFKRAQDTATAVKLAQESLINDKSKIVQSIDAQLTKLLDIGPDSADSLRPVDRSFNPEVWVNQVQEAKFSLKRAQESLDIAKETYVEWFSETPAPAAPTA